MLNKGVVVIKRLLEVLLEDNRPLSWFLKEAVAVESRGESVLYWFKVSKFR